MPIVTMPDGTDVEFPDSMPKEQIRDLIVSKFPELGQEQPSSSILERAAQGFIDTATFGYGDEIEAGLRSTFTSEGYDEALRDVQERQQGASYYTGMLPGLAVPGLGATKVVQKATSGLGKIGAGAAIGAAEGALAGSGFADSGERLEGAGFGALVGAPLGVVGGTVADMIRPSTKAITSKIGIDDTPLPQAKEQISESIKSAAQKLKGRERQAWDLVDASSGQFDTPGVALYLRENMRARLPEISDPDLASYGERLLNRVIPDSEGNKLIGLKDLSNYRKALNRAFSPSNPDKNRVIAELKSVLDDDMVRLTNSALYKGSPQDVNLIKKAKDLTREYKQLYREDKILNRSVINEF